MNIKTVSFLCGLSVLPGHVWATTNLENNNNPISGKIVYAYVTPLIAQLTQQATYTAGDGITVTDNTIAQKVFLSVGDQYTGGIVFKVDVTGQHGLVVACTDQSTGAVWMEGAGANYFSGANSAGEYGGLSNTAIMTAFQASQHLTNVSTENQNASVVATKWNPQYTGMGRCATNSISNCLGDFYLPSPKELNELSQFLLVVNAAITGDGNCLNPATLAKEGVAIQTGVPYWSSLESSGTATKAGSVTLAVGGGGGYSTEPKTTLNFVRAIRAF